MEVDEPEEPSAKAVQEEPAVPAVQEEPVVPAVQEEPAVPAVQEEPEVEAADEVISTNEISMQIIIIVPVTISASLGCFK